MLFLKFNNNISLSSTCKIVNNYDCFTKNCHNAIPFFLVQMEPQQAVTRTNRLYRIIVNCLENYLLSTAEN